MASKTEFISPFSKQAWRTFPLVGFVSQITASFNFTSISIAIDLLTRDGKTTPSWATDTLDSAIYGGAILGMWLMGFVGDRLGRASGMIITLSLSVIGALGSGLLSWGNDIALFSIISAFRFILGFGIGGTFPLSATQAAEGAEGSSVAGKRLTTGMSYSGQAVGYILPYLLVYIMWAASTTFEADWRTCLAFGAVPVLLVMPDAIAAKDGSAFTKKRDSFGNAANLGDEVGNRICTGTYLWKLAGTGGSWFLYDVVSYGVKMFAPTIVEDLFSGRETIGAVCSQNMILNLFGIPAILASLYAIPYFGTKNVIVFSLGVQGVIFILYGLVRWYAPDNTDALFALLCILYFFQSFGAGIGNYIISSETFPVEVRSTFAGLSAAMGKMGAVVGILLFDTLLTLHHGTSITMFTCSGVCLAGVIVATVFLEEQSELEKDEDSKTPLMS